MIEKHKTLNKESQIQLYFDEIAPRLVGGLTQIQIAEELGYSRHQINRAVNAANAPRKQLASYGIEPSSISGGWIKSDDMSTRYKVNTAKAESELKEYIENRIKKIPSVKVPKIKRVKNKDNHLFIYQPCDLHFGKYATEEETGENSSLEITEQKFQDCTDRMIQQAINYNLDEIIFVIGNDVVHTDHPHRKTTAGTPQDTDGQWFEAIDYAVKNMIIAVEKLKQVAPVKMIFCPSNHDYTMGYGIAQILKAHFRNDKNVSGQFTIKHRKYEVYGQSLLGFTHGDGAKPKDLGEIMSLEAKEHWSNTTYRNYYTAHLHHSQVKDNINHTQRTGRSMSATDAWHDRNGYKGSPQGVEGYIHSKTEGEIASLFVKS